ncbi:beta-ketoacyl [acyl carrier protein] synthase domain-containing protein [Streptomyces sp. NPDC054847]
MDEREVLTRFKAGTLERADAVRLLVNAGAHTPDTGPPPLPAAHPAGPAPAAGDGTGVAVVGIAGRYPLAPDLERYWENLREGRDTSSAGPSHRPGPHPLTAGQRAHFLDGAADFDPAFFGLSADEGALMDPQERIFLEVAWEAMENAGCTGARLDALTGPDGQGRSVGVFAAVTTADYTLLAAEAWAHGGRQMPPSGHWGLPGTLQTLLKLTGPGQAVDAAASSGLAAVHLATEALRRGECALAVVGGVELLLHPSRGRHHAGEGAGAVVLKPLARALADGDRIHAVVRSTRTWCGPGGPCAPEGDLHETHRTILRRVGDAGAATGLAALTSAVLQLRHATLAPAEPDGTARPWPRPRDTQGREQPRRATVEIAPDGGPAARTVLEEHLPPPPQPAPDDDVRPGEQILLSAPTPEHLRADAARLADWLAGHEHRSTDTPAALADVARALRAGRSCRPCRIALPADDTDHLVHRLREFAHTTATPTGLTDATGTRFADLRDATPDPLGMAQAPETRDYLTALWRGGRTETLTRLWLSGLDIDWAALQHRPGAAPPPPLPPSAFLRRELWLGRPPEGEGAQTR